MVWKLFLSSSLRKSYSICLENSDLAKLWPFKTKTWPFFGKNWLFWEFLTWNYQTPLWIFLIFGMEVVGSPDVFRLWKEPINSLSFVRPYVRGFRSYSLDRLIFFLIFCMKLCLHTTSIVTKKFFGRKVFLTPKLAKTGQNLAIFGQNSHFWVFWPISKRRYKFS